MGRLWVLLAFLPVAPVLLLFPLLGRLSLTIQVRMLLIPFFTLQGGVEIPGTYPTGLVGGLSTDDTSTCPPMADSPLSSEGNL